MRPSSVYRWAGAALLVLFAVTCLAAEPFPLGVVFAGETATGFLTVANSGSDETMVASVVSDCPCLTVRAEPVLLPAGQAREFPFAFVAKNTGRFTVQVQFQGPAATDPIVAAQAVTGVVADRSWIVRAPELLASKSEYLVVDLRATAAFTRARIPRSVNRPAFAVRTTAQWKEKSIVLVDEGFAPADLLVEVVSLRAAGFRDVRALEGGITAWARNGGRLEGVETTPVELAQIVPAQFARSQQTNDWRVVDLATEAEAKLAELSRLAAVPAGRLPVRVLVMADENTYARVENRCGASNVATLFYLKGGSSALRDFEASQQAVARGVVTGVVVSKQSSRVPLAPGCSACGR